MHGGVMKVALVSPYSWAHPGGVNNHISGLAGKLAGRGHSVTIIAPEATGHCAAGRLVDAGRSVPVPANGSVARLALAPGTSGRIRREIERGGFDVVHVHEPMVPMISIAAVRAADCRVVATFHSAGDGPSVLYRLAAACIPGVPGRLDVRIAVSEAARDQAARYLPGEYLLVPNGVDVERFSGAPRTGRSDGAPEILFVGRNEPRKGLSVLLDAFPEVCRRVPGARLKIIGSGVTGASIAQSLAPPLRDRVTVLGFVENEELPGHYAAADVFCAPALGGESFGIVLVEAMAAGTPVVASDIPGYRAVVEQAGGGVLFQPGRPSDLAGKLSALLADARRREAIAAKGSRGVERFSWEAVTPRIESIYRG